jgi:hypothetical protein
VPRGRIASGTALSATQRQRRFRARHRLTSDLDGP